MKSSCLTQYGRVFFGQFSVCHAEQAGASGQGGHAVRNNDDGLVTVLRIQDMQEFFFVQHIKGTGRFIHDNDIGIRQHDPGDADALALAAGQSCAHLAHRCVIAFGQGWQARRFRYEEGEKTSSLTGRFCRRRLSGNSGESLFEIGDDIVNMFGADGKPDGCRLDPAGQEFFLTQLGMGRGSRMDDQ